MVIANHYIVLDVETTGLDPATDRIVEIALAEVKAGAIVLDWSTLVQPGRPIGAGAAAVNGLTDADLASASGFGMAASTVGAWLSKGLPVFAHCAPFDRSFVEAELRRVQMPVPAANWQCSRDLARSVLAGLPSYKLTDLAAHLQLPPQQAHRALGDVRAVVALIEALRAKQAMAGTAIIAPKPQTALVHMAIAAMAPLANSAQTWIATAQGLPCDNEEQEQRVNKAILAFKDLQKRGIALRQSHTETIKAQTTEIERAYRGRLLAPIDDVLAHLEQVRQPLALRRAEAAAAERRRIAAEAEAAAIAAYRVSIAAKEAEVVAETKAILITEAAEVKAAAIIAAPLPVATGTVKDKMEWVCEIVDASQVPRDWWTPDLELISRAVTQSEGQLQIAGVMVTPRIATQTRKARK